MDRTIFCFLLLFAVLLGLIWLKVDLIEQNVNYTMQSELIVEEKIDGTYDRFATSDILPPGALLPPMPILPPAIRDATNESR